MSLNISLAGTISFITGSSKGIGLSIARSLLDCGSTVILNGRNKELLEKVSTELGQIYGTKPNYFVGDVSNVEFLSNTYKEIKKTYGKLDILINNAGILKDALIGMCPDTDLQSMLQVNIAGVLNNMSWASRLMSRNTNGGSIINLASVVGRFGNSGQLIYSATKSAVIGATLSASKELAHKKIRVNAIAPGLIDTEMIKSIPAEKLQKLVGNIQIGRIGKPEDIGPMVCFLCSDYASYVTGQVIGIDGGIIL